MPEALQPGGPPPARIPSFLFVVLAVLVASGAVFGLDRALPGHTHRPARVAGQALPPDPPLDPARPPETYTNGLGMAFVYVPAGTFTMGTASGRTDEQPPHRVRITKPFYLGRYEVTQQEWAAVMGTVPSVFHGPDRPVDGISWQDARRFVERLNADTDCPGCYRLPTEAEWEYAARAGGEGPDDPASLCAYANVADASTTSDPAILERAPCHDGFPETAPVGALAPNALGLHDMLGNVMEWVADAYAPDTYQAGPIDDPAGPAEGWNRVLRGGSWQSAPAGARPTARNAGSPRTRDARIGMRLVRALPATP